MTAPSGTSPATAPARIAGQRAQTSAGRLHVICERDTGLFSLIQQVIANVPWAIRERRTPVVYFGAKTCYWTPNGYRGRDTVWEYYFEPLFVTHPAACIPVQMREQIAREHPSPFEIGYPIEPYSFVSSHFGDHPALTGRTLPIPYFWDDPCYELRLTAARIVHRFIRPRAYVQGEADLFTHEHFQDRYVVGVHARGTDAISKQELREHRQGSLRLSEYANKIARLVVDRPTAKIFVATDAQSSLDYFKERFGSRVITYSSIRHVSGEMAAVGPAGWIMPTYVAADRDRAAENGKEAVVDYLLLSRCQHLVHNGSSLARTVLLNVPELAHTNTHRKAPCIGPSAYARKLFSWLRAQARR
jgi:Nodulation protein Z (NodZ)